MKGADRFLRGAGTNVRESMGAGGAGGDTPAVPQPPAPPNRWAGAARVAAALIPLDRIAPDPDQPRKEFDPEAIGRLAASLRDRGQVQPIRVRWDEAGEIFIIVAGERRWRAAQLAGLPAIAAVEAPAGLAAEDVLEEQLVENCLREDLRPIEQAEAYRRLMAARGWTGTELAARLHVAKGTVSRALALLGLPDEVRESVDAGALAPATAYELSKLPGPAAQAEAARAVAEAELTRGEAAELVRAIRSRRPAPGARPAPVLIDLGDGTTVKVAWSRRNGVTAAQALRRAAREIQARERADAGQDAA